MTTWDSSAARQMALHRWATVQDASAATAPARDGFLARFAHQVDPDGLLEPGERDKRARRAMRAYMIGLSRRSRSRRAAAKLQAKPSE